MKEKNTNKNSKIKVRREIYVTALILIVLFAGLIYSLLRYQLVESKDFIYNTYNSRYSVFSEDVVRGSIYTADGTLVASTQMEDDKEVRYYPYDGMFAHAVGYTAKGMSGIEAEYSFDLLKSHNDISSQISDDISGTKTHGDNVITTLDFNTQETAYKGLGMYDGAVIAIEPDTGKVIAMVSRPSFNPNTLSEEWDKITAEDSNSTVLLNRATSGAYPPGSTFKIISTIAYMRANGGSTDFSYDCKGSFTIGEDTIHCSSGEKHGSLDLESAFYESCNSAYASIGASLDRDSFIKTADELLFNTDLPTELYNVRKSRFKVTKDTDDFTAAQTAIGQGDTTVSPLHLCMLVSAIANGGDLMEPYMVERIESEDGFVVSENAGKKYGEIFSYDEVNTLKKYMKSVVEDGTAAKVDFGGLTVYGKTGTAQYTSSKDLTHSWFVGYATASNGKKLAVAVVMEGAGYGSKHAAPLAAEVFNAYFDSVD